MVFLGFLFYLNRDKKDFKVTWGVMLDGADVTPEMQRDVTDDEGIAF
jgi:hypothetical protein